MAAAKRVAVLRDAASTIVPSAVEAVRRWLGRWVRNRYHQASSRGVVVCRNRRVGPGSSGMRGSPTVYHFRAIGWGIPSRWKTIRTSDELPRSRQLADGELTVPQSQINRRASFWHAQSVRCTCPNLCLRPGKGLYARIGGQLDSRFGRCIFGLRKSCCICSRTEPLGAWVGVAARTIQPAA